MPRLDLTSTLRTRLSPEEQQILAVVAELINDMRASLALPPVTDAEIETRLRALAGVSLQAPREGMP